MEQMSSKGEVNAALVLALSGAIAVLVAKGSGPLSLKRVVSGPSLIPSPGKQGRRRTVLARPSRGLPHEDGVRVRLP